MNSVMKSTVLWAVLALLLCITLGITTAPLGVPIVAFLVFGLKPNFSPALDAIGSSEFFADWFSYAPRLLSAETGTKCLIAWCFTVVALIGIAYACYRLDKPKRNVNQGVLGNAKLITKTNEIRKRNDFWDGKGTPDKAGLVIGSSKHGYVFDSSIPHWSVIGKTGAGKTFLMVIQTLHICMAASWNLIITGKNELLELTGEKAVELGYDRIIFDLKGYPGASSFNPLALTVDYIDEGNLAEAQRCARQTAADLIPFNGEANSYFAKAARSCLTALILIVAMADIPTDQKNMSSVRKLLDQGTTSASQDPSAPLKNYIRSSEVGPEHPAYAPASEFLSDGGVTVAGKNVLSTLKEALSIFSDEGIARITAKSDSSIRDIIRNKTVIYIHLLEEGDPYLIIMTVFLNQYWRVAQQEAALNGGRLPRETAIIGDEWGNLPKVQAMPEIATLGRSYRLHAYCFTQDGKQWNKYSNYSDQNAGRDKILGSMGGKVALSLSLPEDCQYFTRLAGKRTVRTQNTSTSKHGSGIGVGGGRSEGYAEHSDDLIHEWEWIQRAAIRDGIIAIKGAENTKPGREGIFQIPVTYASKTPAGQFFGLGSEEECDMKRMAFRRSMEHRLTDGSIQQPTAWAPNFAAFEPEPTHEARVASDEWSAWDGM